MPMNRVSTSLCISRMEIKTTVSNHFIPVRIARITKADGNKYWKGNREVRILIRFWGECKMIQQLWETVMNVSSET